MINDPADWPADLRWALEAYLKKRETWTEKDEKLYGPPMGYPRFLLFDAQSRELVLTAWGLNNGWNPLMAPKLKELISNS